MKNKEKDVITLLGLLMVLGVIIIIPIIIIFTLIMSPCNMIFVFFKKRKRKKELRKKLYINKGKIYFLYKDYNQFNFDDFFKEKDISIKSVKVEGNLYNDVLLYHFSKSFTTKGFPMLIKIEENEIKIKRHFNSFKHYVKRNKDSQSFYTLLKRSIKNLE